MQKKLDMVEAECVCALKSYFKHLKKACSQLLFLNGMVRSASDEAKKHAAPPVGPVHENALMDGAFATLNALHRYMLDLSRIQKNEQAEVDKDTAMDDPHTPRADAAASAAWFDDYCHCMEVCDWFMEGTESKAAALARLKEVIDRKPAGFDILVAMLYENNEQLPVKH